MSASIDLAEELKKILDEYEIEVIDDVDKAALATAKLGVKELKEKSPKSKRAEGGAYAKSWGYRKERMPFGYTSYVIHNRKHYQLTHLLENGHLVKNQYGSYGRTKAIPHIKPVELIVQENFIEDLTKRLN
jgi:hypothetical protein